MAPKRRRADRELVRRGLAGSVAEAAELVSASRVISNGFPVRSANSLVSVAEGLHVSGLPPRFVSRGGDKLNRALEDVGVDVLGHNLVVSDRYCLDVGASTGGFTDCLLSRGARGVVAIDSGRAQLHASLVSNPRVDLRERTVARDLEQRSLAGPIELVVADVSFCGLVQAIAPAIALTSESAEFVLLVKPQFESTQAEMAGSGGVVRDPALWTSAMLRVEHGLLSLGLAPVAWSLASPAGPKGNREFFVRARRFSVMDPHLGSSRLDTTLAAARSLARAAIAAAIAEGMPSRRS